MDRSFKSALKKNTDVTPARYAHTNLEKTDIFDGVLKFTNMKSVYFSFQ